VQGLTSKDRFYLLVGAVAACWYGVSGILKTFNSLSGVQLNEEDEETVGTQQTGVTVKPLSDAQLAPCSQLEAKTKTPANRGV
jgi:hypothetical protein